MTDHDNQQLPTIDGVMRSVTPVLSGMPVREVVAIFQGNPDLVMIPVVGAGIFEGVISRRDLFTRHLSRPFAMELFGKKPISSLMNCAPPVITPGCDVNEALVMLLEHDPGLDTDSFPVIRDGECVGIVHVAELLMAISRSQARLLATLEALNARIHEEVEKARQIQRDLLPPAACRYAGLVLDAVLLNSSEISGDVYDYFFIDQDRLGVMVGDVSGHGIQSGMVATAAKAGLHLLLDSGVTTPGKLLGGMNKAVTATASNSLMMTAVVAVIDRKAGTASLANAGHNYPFLYRSADETVAMLDGTSGFPLGFDRDSEYGEIEIDFGRGDLLALYSDGIVEASNGEGEEFGYERFAHYARHNSGESPESFRGGLLDEVRGFTGAASFEDDVTLLVVAAEQVP
ncbi:SpoIIE family protein phosphatase [Oryzomonas japonica]|uniref:SpoIIE family protein phosphatase n=1 Tax=Oryzomonas japonica TaxID=2603858 RepID=A0A7J4ZN75_9BACT|nr:SpoIIE family protein phosphatase [Oryzomonas japonica]KAB0664243.1 SpoIIE family protein phosphatase [Oryzomonas japonica]